jgi:hypothetical protein
MFYQTAAPLFRRHNLKVRQRSVWLSIKPTARNQFDLLRPRSFVPMLLVH